MHFILSNILTHTQPHNTPICKSALFTNEEKGKKKKDEIRTEK